MKLSFLKPFDFVFLGLSVCAVIFSFAALKGNRSQEARVLIKGYGEEFIFPLDEDREVTVKGEIGNSVIKIEGGAAFFIDSPCPNHLCTDMSPCKNDNDWAACLPNNVFIRVEKSDD